MKANAVSATSFVERGSKFERLDAEFVDPEVLTLEGELVQMYGAKPLGFINVNSVKGYRRPKVCTGSRQKYVAIDDIDLQDGMAFHQELAEVDLPERAKQRLEPYYILVSNVRPERGGVGMIIESQNNAIGSSGISVVRIADETRRHVAFAFLRSEYARKQLVRRSRGSMYPAITKDDVNEIQLPSFPKRVETAVGKAVAESLDARSMFFELLNVQSLFVECFLQESLGDPPPDIVWDSANELSLNVTRMDIVGPFGADRFDAEFHRREFVDFERRLRAKDNVEALGKSYEAFAGGNPMKGATTVLKLRQAQLSGFGVKVLDCEKIENAAAGEKVALRLGDILIGCTAHEPRYVGNRVDIMDNRALGVSIPIVPVPDVMVIRQRFGAGGPPPDFVAKFLSSPWGRRQFQRLNRGVRGGHVYGRDVESFVHLPIPPEEWLVEFGRRQKNIRAERSESNELMQAAVGLLETYLAERKH